MEINRKIATIKYIKRDVVLSHGCSFCQCEVASAITPKRIGTKTRYY